MFVSQENLWVYGLLEIGLVNVFMGLFLGFIYGSVSWIFVFFFVFLDLMEIGFGYWNWIWGLLVFNLIFSSFCLCSSDMGLSSWLCCCDLSSWLLGSCSCDV